MAGLYSSLTLNNDLYYAVNKLAVMQYIFFTYSNNSTVTAIRRICFIISAGVLLLDH